MYLEIHLNGGDALLGAGNFEVHIAEEILKTLDIDHGHEAVALGDKAAGDTRNGSLNGHASRHKRKGRAADGALRGGAVGGKNLGDDSDGVGELLDRGENGDQRTLCKSTVTDLTSAGASAGLGLADGVGGEVVVMHITLGVLFVKAVKHLSVAHGAEGGNGEYLSLTSGEHTRAVNSVKQVDLGVKRTDLVDASAVNTLAVVEQPAAHDVLLNLIQALVDLDLHIGINLIEFLVNLLIYGLQALVTDSLVIGIEGGADILYRKVLDSLVHIGIGVV